MFYYVSFMGTCVLRSRNAEQFPAVTLRNFYSHFFLTQLTSAKFVQHGPPPSMNKYVQSNRVVLLS